MLMAGPRVSSEKEKSFREIFFSIPFRFVFAFRSLAKNAKIFAFLAKFRFNLVREKNNAKISRKK